MGIDFLDVSFRIEREFGVDPRGDELRRLGLQRHPPDVTAAELHEIICQRYRTVGVAPPEDSWPRLQAILAEALGRELADVNRDSWLVEDLGME